MQAPCPSCGHLLDVTRRETPYQLRCPNCHRSLRVPASTPSRQPTAPPADPGNSEDPADSVLQQIAADAAQHHVSGGRGLHRRRSHNRLPYVAAIVAIVAVGIAAAFLAVQLAGDSDRGHAKAPEPIEAQTTPSASPTDTAARTSSAPATEQQTAARRDATQNESPQENGPAARPSRDERTEETVLAQLVELLQQGDHQVQKLADAGIHRTMLGGTLHRLRLDGNEVWAITFASTEDLKATLQKLANGEALLPQDSFPESWVGPLRFFSNEQAVVFHASLDEKLYELLPRALGSPLAYTPHGDSSSDIASLPSMKRSAAGETEVDDPTSTGAAPDSRTTQVIQASADWDELQELFEQDKLLRMNSYNAVRNVLALEVEQRIAESIESTWKQDAPSLITWLRSHPDIAEEFFLAMDEQHDKIPEALGLFRQLYEADPDRFESYAQLAISIAVTWDQPRAVSSDSGPKRQAKAADGGPPATALDTYEFYVEAEPVMQGRILYLPWEMLLHVVNHRTPLAERQWALQNYLGRRQMIGKCYSEVPYDYASLKFGAARGALFEKPYTLPSIRTLGGVCAHQADFASRVARCLGVPAAYVTGQSRYGDHHAWVMWVELKQVTANGIAFTLESHGRYRGDMFYVGNLIDPQTARPTTDRELELTLHTVGLNPQARRHAARLMAIYPRLSDGNNLTPKQRLTYLRRVLELSPGYQGTWRALAAMAKEKEVRETQQQQMKAVMNTLFRTFARYPDFTWKIFGDLVAFEEDARKQNELDLRLISLYESAKRPDLGFQARLATAKRLSEQGDKTSAATLLADGIRRFPEEGRYVPRVLDELERICQDFEGGNQLLIPFYTSFLPAIPQKRGNAPSKYCMEMYRRAVQRFQAAGRPDLAQRYQLELNKLESLK